MRTAAVGTARENQSRARFETRPTNTIRSPTAGSLDPLPLALAKPGKAE